MFFFSRPKAAKSGCISQRQTQSRYSQCARSIYFFFIQIYLAFFLLFFQVWFFQLLHTHIDVNMIQELFFVLELIFVISMYTSLVCCCPIFAFVRNSFAKRNQTKRWKKDYSELLKRTCHWSHLVLTKLTWRYFMDLTLGYFCACCAELYFFQLGKHELLMEQRLEGIDQRFLLLCSYLLFGVPFNWPWRGWANQC